MCECKKNDKYQVCLFAANKIYQKNPPKTQTTNRGSSNFVFCLVSRGGEKTSKYPDSVNFLRDPANKIMAETNFT